MHDESSDMIVLLLLTTIMGACSFAAGMLPLMISLSEERLKLVSTLGMGVLMGTSLIVIIPEGVETLYGGSGGTGESTESGGGASSHSFVGLAMVLGFLMMYLIDKIPTLIQPHKPHSQPYIAVDNLNELGAYGAPNGVEDLASNTKKEGARRSLSTTIGLVIHSAADGIAFGASATSSNIALTGIVFFAILLHKCPAAFSLSVLLLKNGLAKKKVRQHLTVFSLAAPAGAIATYLVILLITPATSDDSSTQWWTGLILLFSGGTFL